MSDLITRATALAREAHKGQVDKQDRDYFTHHLLPVAEMLRPFGVNAYIAGLLHDILEDTETIETDLYIAGFPHQVVDAVVAVTRMNGEAYPDLIRRAAAHPLGRLVKLADNWLNLTGLDALARTDPEKAASLGRRYRTARETLERSLSEGR